MREKVALTRKKVLDKKGQACSLLLKSSLFAQQLYVE